MGRSNDRHPGDERVLGRVWPDPGYVSKSRRKSAKFGEIREFLDPTFHITINPRLGLLLAPESGLQIGLFCAPEPKKSLIGTRDLAHFLHGRCGLRIAFVKKARSYSVNKDPRSDIFLFGKRTRGNSALHRSYITNSDGELGAAETSCGIDVHWD